MTDNQLLGAIDHGFAVVVFLRNNTRSHAARPGLIRRLRNLPDGSVRVIAEGRRGQLDRLVARFHRGPELADVERVATEWKGATGTSLSHRIVRCERPMLGSNSIPSLAPIR